ncbi:MAG TPA: YkgJ family cysteine cluster protein [Lysobacter sp.]
MPDRQRSTTTQPSAHAIGPADCGRCDAVCCRLTVVVQPEDHIPSHLTTELPGGLRVMAKDEDGWCVAMDGSRMNCGIYDSRPDVCRRFVMGGPYCNAIREDYAREHARHIELILQ